MTKLKYGIVGVGNRGRALARAALRTSEVDIIAFADPHPPSRSAFSAIAPDARGYQRGEDLLSDNRLDAVIIATPNNCHTELALAAIHADRHVLCEKPLAPTMEECELIGAAATQSQRIFQVGMELRYAPLFRAFQAIVSDGRVGVPKMLWCHEFRPAFKPGVGNWRLSRASSGGTLLEKNCHHFDLFNWLSGARPARVQGIGSNDSIYTGLDILDRAWVLVEYTDGVQASLGLALFFDREEQLELGAVGTAGKLTCRLPESQLRLDTAAGSLTREVASPEEGLYAHGGEIEQQLAFVHSIRTGEPPLVDVEAAKWSHAVSLAAEAAIRTGVSVRIDSTGHPLV